MKIKYALQIIRKICNACLDCEIGAENAEQRRLLNILTDIRKLLVNANINEN